MAPDLLTDLRSDAERWKRSEVATRILLNDSRLDAADALLVLVDEVARLRRQVANLRADVIRHGGRPGA
jgi:hypothetical protein